MAEHGSAPTGWLEVSRAELRAALEMLHKFANARGAGHALVGFESGALVIRLGGVRVDAPARGSWPGEAAVPGAFLANFHESLPPGDPVTVLVDRERLRIGPFAVRCTWLPRIEPRITLPVDARLPHVLRLPLEYAREEIERSGLGDVLARAEAERDSILEKAAVVLEPFEIPDHALRAFVEGYLRYRFGLGRR